MFNTTGSYSICPAREPVDELYYPAREPVDELYEINISPLADQIALSACESLPKESDSH